MPAPISVLIPTLNAATSLGPVLAGVYDAMSAGLVCEVILADGGSSDDTVQIGRDLGCKIVQSAPGRGVQLEAGAEAARGDWLLVLHADTAPQGDWVEAVRDHITGSADAAYFRLSFDDPSVPARLVSVWANLRSRLFGLPYGDQGLLVPMPLYRSVGGYPRVPLMEDVAIARRLKGRLRMLNARVVTSAARYRRDGWLRRGWHNLTTLGLYFWGVEPRLLAERYRRSG